MCFSLRSYFSVFFFFYCYGDPGDLHFSLHDALPIWIRFGADDLVAEARDYWHLEPGHRRPPPQWGDRKSTRLNSSHQIISYAVFCLKKKKTRQLRRAVC